MENFMEKFVGFLTMNFADQRERYYIIIPNMVIKRDVFSYQEKTIRNYNKLTQILNKIKI